MAAAGSGDVGLVKMPTVEELESRNGQIRATLYGQCVGDCVGLLTEFLTKREAKKHYKQTDLEYHMKIDDAHRSRWKVGDWTDDSDQMLLILLSLVDQRGQVNIQDFAEKMKNWMRRGFPELGDAKCFGIGEMTSTVLKHPDFAKDPHKVAMETWAAGGGRGASNGGVMRTSVVGTHCWWDTQRVVKTALDIVQCTHYHSRCQASAVAVSVCISLMLQRGARHLDDRGGYRVDRLIQDTYPHAAACLATPKEKQKLWKYMSFKDIKGLDLGERGRIGYTYKSMGAGFWALKQDNFRKAIQKITMQGGDADTNACVAGAMLGCKLGVENIPESWTGGLRHREWLDQQIDRWLSLQKELGTRGSNVEPVV